MALTVSRRIFYLLLIFSPLAFGTVEPWSYAVMETGAAAAALALIYHLYQSKSPLYQTPGMVPLALFLGFLLVQILPLPPGLVSVLSSRAHGIHQAGQSLTGQTSWMPLSVYPKATLSEFFRYGTYVLFYFLGVQLLTDKKTVRTVVFMIAVFGSLLAFSSILQHYMTEDAALWVRKVPSDASVFGPYINRNHYAGLMEMLFPVTLGLFFFYRPRLGSASVLQGIAEIFSQEKANIHLLIGCGALLIATSIFISLSRGGIISTCLSLIIFTVLLMKRKISRGNTLMVITIIVTVVLAVSWFGWDQILNRFEKLQDRENSFALGRKIYWSDSMGIIRDFTVTGSGFGTFRNIYPSYQTADIDNLLTHAHNDYVELAAEGGLVAVIIVLAFFIQFIPRTYRTFKKRRDAFSIYLYMGGLTGLCALLFHSFTDFNFHIGANGLWFAFTAAFIVGTAHTRIRKKDASPTLLASVDSKKQKTITAIGISVFSILAVVYAFSHFMGTVYYNSIKDYKMSIRSNRNHLETVDDTAARAEMLDPLDGKYPFTRGLAHWYMKDQDTALNHFNRAVMRDPLNAQYLERYGFFMSGRGEDAKARTAFEAATRYDTADASAWLNYGAWLLINKEKQTGINCLRKALSMDEKLVDRILTAMAIAGLSFEEMEAAIPEQTASAIAFAKFLDDSGRRKQAVERYLEAIGLAEKDTPPNKYHFRRIYQFFHKRTDLKNAMRVLERGEKVLPDEPWFKIILGDLYARQGILFKAREYYEEALLLDPQNKNLLKRLSRLNP